MDWAEWKPLYLRIVDMLGLDVEADRRATAMLDRLLASRDVDDLVQKLRRTIYDTEVIVCGAAPSLDAHLRMIKEQHFADGRVVIAADGALEALIGEEVHCDIVVTDLDGDRGGLIPSTRQGTLAVVHAHGDNIPLIRSVVPRASNIIGSTQVEPTEHVHLWGGFTDGDRACYLAAHYSPRKIILAGMDFGSIVGRWSKPACESASPASRQKRLKMSIGRWLLSTIEKRFHVPLTYVDNETVFQR